MIETTRVHAALAPFGVLIEKKLKNVLLQLHTMHAKLQMN